MESTSLNWPVKVLTLAFEQYLLWSVVRMDHHLEFSEIFRDAELMDGNSLFWPTVTSQSIYLVTRKILSFSRRFVDHFSVHRSYFIRFHRSCQSKQLCSRQLEIWHFLQFKSVRQVLQRGIFCIEKAYKSTGWSIFPTWSHPQRTNKLLEFIRRKKNWRINFWCREAAVKKLDEYKEGLLKAKADQKKATSPPSSPSIFYSLNILGKFYQMNQSIRTTNFLFNSRVGHERALLVYLKEEKMVAPNSLLDEVSLYEKSLVYDQSLSIAFAEVHFL